jgi:hypothetical protein
MLGWPAKASKGVLSRTWPLLIGHTQMGSIKDPGPTGGDHVIYHGAKGKRGYLICSAAGTLAAILAFCSLHFAYAGWKCRQVELIYPWLTFWVIVTPVWFWFEYFVIFRKYGDSTAFDSFKHGQQLSLAIWAALVFFLNGLVSAEHFKEAPQSPTSCEVNLTDLQVYWRMIR